MKLHEEEEERLHLPHLETRSRNLMFLVSGSGFKGFSSFRIQRFSEGFGFKGSQHFGFKGFRNVSGSKVFGSLIPQPDRFGSKLWAFRVQDFGLWF